MFQPRSLWELAVSFKVGWFLSGQQQADERECVVDMGAGCKQRQVYFLSRDPGYNTIKSRGFSRMLHKYKSGRQVRPPKLQLNS